MIASNELANTLGTEPQPHVADGCLALAGPEAMTPEEKLRWSMCERKNRYDRRGARTMINYFNKLRGRHGRPDGLRAYQCPFCSGWHVTKIRWKRRLAGKKKAAVARPVEAANRRLALQHYCGMLAWSIV